MSSQKLRLRLHYVALHLRPVYSDATQLNSTSSWVQLSCVAIDTLTDATQLSPAIGNATDPVAVYSQSARSRSVELSWVELCRYKRAFTLAVILTGAAYTCERSLSVFLTFLQQPCSKIPSEQQKRLRLILFVVVAKRFCAYTLLSKSRRLQSLQ